MSLPMFLAVAEDPAQSLRAWLEEHTRMGWLFSSILVFLLLTMGAHGTVEAGRKLARENRWRAFAVLLLLLGLGMIAWWSSLAGALVTLGAMVLLFWPAFRGGAGLVRRARARRNGRPRS